MKVEVVKNGLKDALLALDRVTGKNLSLPILSHVLFLAGEKGITLRATNLDIGVEMTIPAKVHTEGVIAVPAGILGNYLSLVQDQKNTIIELVGNNLTISSSTHSTIIKCSPYEDFPSIPIIQKGKHISVDVQHFIQGLRSVIFAAAVSDIKPEFSSIYLYGESGYLHAVATDSSRLAEKRVPVHSIDEDFSILLPAKNATEIIRLLEPISGNIDLYSSGSQFSCVAKNLYITSRLIDGLFPDYKQIIPKTIISEATVLREDLLNTLKITNIFSGKLQQIRLNIDPPEKRLEVGTRNDEVGETMNQIDAVLKGERVDLVFNQRFLSDVLQIIPQDSISLQSGGVGKPLMIRGIGDQSYLYLVMPMRVV
jgi:DNA polymerase-3 subunit beta